jgi:hypothetical protein
MNFVRRGMVAVKGLLMEWGRDEKQHSTSITYKIQTVSVKAKFLILVSQK